MKSIIAQIKLIIGIFSKWRNVGIRRSEIFSIITHLISTSLSIRIIRGYKDTFLNLKALRTTERELILITAPAIIGFNRNPKNG